MTQRNVIGSLFADYVRMIRAHKDVDWRKYLAPADLSFLVQRIDPAAWYPMESFERMGNGILAEIALRDLELVRLWGRIQVDQLRAAHRGLVAPGDPVESMMRFRVLRATFFDFEALWIPSLADHEAQIVLGYHMGKTAEEAACWQTLGFFERLVEVAGAIEPKGRFTSRSWDGDDETTIELVWR